MSNVYVEVEERPIPKGFALNAEAWRQANRYTLEQITDCNGTTVVKITDGSGVIRSIKADIVIVYGNMEGSIEAENVVVQNNIYGEVKADKVLCSEVQHDACYTCVYGRYYDEDIISNRYAE